MRAVVQRVQSAQVAIDGRVHTSIGAGLLALIGVAADDQELDAFQLARKIVELRIFEDETGRMNRSIGETGGAVLAVSQFTLLGDCRKGKRPSFSNAAPPEMAKRLYELSVQEMRAAGVPVETGVFRAMMDITLVNQGPVTLLLDSRKQF